MKLMTYKLDRNRKKIDIKEFDFNKFERFAATGWGFALKYVKGKTIFFTGEWLFDEMLKRQKQNNEAVANRYFSYARIDENQNSSKQNTLRDNKGRPVRIYEEKEDCFLPKISVKPLTLVMGI